VRARTNNFINVRKQTSLFLISMFKKEAWGVTAPISGSGVVAYIDYVGLGFVSVEGVSS
jgi:hypothetical protein